MRSTFYNGRLAVRGPAGQVERRLLDSAAEYRATLNDTFGLALSDATVAALLTALDRAGTRGATHPFFD